MFHELIKYSRPTANEVPCLQCLDDTGIIGGPHRLAPCCETYVLQQINNNNKLRNTFTQLICAGKVVSFLLLNKIRTFQRTISKQLTLASWFIFD